MVSARALGVNVNPRESCFHQPVAGVSKELETLRFQAGRGLNDVRLASVNFFGKRNLLSAGIAAAGSKLNAACSPTVAPRCGHFAAQLIRP